MMMGMQKGKHHKRKKSWHRGRGEFYRFQRAMDKWPLKESVDNGGRNQIHIESNSMDSVGDMLFRDNVE